jgi:outer membrane receptor protein involved in Fe transport
VWKKGGGKNLFKQNGLWSIGAFLSLAVGMTATDVALSQTVEEIIVTARKREESLQDVPISITAFTAEQLREQGAFNNEDVALLTVNFNTARTVGRRLDRPVIRGMSSAAVGGEPNASYFIDGAFVSGSVATATLGPVERVEVLRGPQSVQFGRATFAGAVNYITRKPTNEFESEILVKGGNNDTQLISGWTSGPLVEDKLTYFAAAAWDHYGGEWRNNLEANVSDPANFIDPAQGGDNSDLGGTDTKDIVGKLLWTPNDTTQLTFKLGYTKGDDDHYVQRIQEPGELNCYLPTLDNADEIWFESSKGAFCGNLDIESVDYHPDNPFNPNNPDFDPTTYFPVTNLNGPGRVPNLPLIASLPVDGGPRQSRLNHPDFYAGMELPDLSSFAPGTGPEDWIASPEKPGTRREQTRSLIQYDQDIGDWSMSTRLAANWDSMDAAFDLDRTQLRPLGGNFTSYEESEWNDQSVEIKFDSPGDSALRGSIGVYYYNFDGETKQKRFVSTGLGQLKLSTESDTDNAAIFGSLEYDISDKWTATTEARIARDKKTIKSPKSCGDDPDTPELEGQRLEDEITTDAFTPRFTLRYTPTSEAMVYALIAKGNKPADFNNAYFRRTTEDPCLSLEAVAEGIAVVKEEKSWTYEVGGKSSWFENRLVVNLAVFYIDWRNQSVSQLANVNGRLTEVTRNAGKSEVKGLEIETSFLITDNLSGNLSYGLADGQYLDYNDKFLAETTGVGLLPNGELDNDANNARGNAFPNAPKHSIVAGLNYDHVLADDLNWFAGTTYTLESKRYGEAANFANIGNRKLWNGRLGLQREKWTLTSYVNNILDEHTATALFPFEYLQGLTWADTGSPVQAYSGSPMPGRQYGVEFLYRFRN